MAIRMGRRLFIMVLIGIAIIIVGKFTPSPPEEITPVEQPAQMVQTTPDFELTAVQVGSDGRRILTCYQGNCQALPPVNQDTTSAVTDGQSWYYYRQTNDRNNNKALVKTAIATGDTTTIVEQTPLAAPRGLHISPDNQKVIYWLDNINRPAKQLTELWFHDINANGTQLLAEKITQSAVISKLRWNRTSNIAWFIGDTSEPKASPKIELLTATINPPGISAAFPDVDWTELQEIADHGVMDISQDGQALAYVSRSFNNRYKLTIIQQDKPPQTATLKGDIVYLQWRENGELIYIIQDQENFSFWQTAGTLHKQIARRPGRIESLRGNTPGTYLVFAVRDQNRSRAYALDTDQGTITDQGALPVFSDHTYLVQFQTKEPASNIAGITSSFTDEEIVAFVEQHLVAITSLPAAQPKRIIITAKPNTVFLEYRNADNTNQRLLLTVRDIAHTEWSISAYYQDRAGEWVKTQGGGLTDPEPKRLYEWEQGFNQWILKEEY